MYPHGRHGHKVTVTDHRMNLKVQGSGDKVTQLLNSFASCNFNSDLRKFIIWCSYQCNSYIKPLQHKLFFLAENFIEGTIGSGELQLWYAKTEGMAVASETVGLPQGSKQAAAFLISRETVNPDALDGALQAAKLHLIWAETYYKEGNIPQIIEHVHQRQINYLLDLMNSREMGIKPGK